MPASLTLTPMTPAGWSDRPAWRRGPLLLAVLMLHALMLLSLQLARRAPVPAAEAPRLAISLRLLTPSPAAAPAPRDPATAKQPTRTSPPPHAAETSQPTAQLRLIAPAPPSPLPAARATTTTPAPDADKAAPQSDAAPTPESGRLIDSAATRRALRDAARGPLNDERFGQANGIAPAPDASQRMAQQVQRGAKGDCQSGEYLGGGMGLLSLPFYLAAEAAGKCARHAPPKPPPANQPEPQGRVGAHASMREQ